MKKLTRSYNEIGLHNILSGIGGNQKIRIEERLDYWTNEPIYEGRAGDIPRDDDVIYMKYFGLSADNNVLVISVRKTY